MPAKPPPMKGSVKLGEFAGIGVYIHWTFFLLPVLLAATELMADGPLANRLSAAAFSVLVILATFACVVLHEFGHALTARRFGVKTRDIVLLPIGGVARLERIPRNPVQELWIALAGPAVNVVIAAAIGVGLLAVGLLRGDIGSVITSTGPFAFPATMLAVNVVLIAFNMIPAFPMDGGRVLRALLAMRLEYSLATTIAARVGQVVAVAFFALGLYFGHIMIMLVGGMVFLGAAAEVRQATLLARLDGLSVADAMMTNFYVVSSAMPLARCAELLLEGSQRDFPVVDSPDENDLGRYVGMLTRESLLQAIARGGENETAGEHATDIAPRFGRADPAMAALESIQAAGVAAAPVLREGTPIGLVTIENIAELLELRTVRVSATRPINRPLRA